MFGMFSQSYVYVRVSVDKTKYLKNVTAIFFLWRQIKYFIKDKIGFKFFF